MPRESTTKTVSIYRDLRRWVEENGVYVSTVLNAALYLLKDNGVAIRTRNVETARRALMLAVLRELGLDVNEETLDDIIARRAVLSLTRPQPPTS